MPGYTASIPAVRIQWKATSGTRAAFRSRVLSRGHTNQRKTSAEVTTLSAKIKGGTGDILHTLAQLGVPAEAPLITCARNLDPSLPLVYHPAMPAPLHLLCVAQGHPRPPRLLAAVVVLAVLSSCRENAAPPRPVAAPVGSPTIAVPALPTPIDPRSGPGVICGASRCAASEICCGFDRSGAVDICVKATSSVMDTCVSALRAAQAMSDGYSVHAASCDESSDCGENEFCCEKWIPGPSAVKICTSHPDKDCSLAEECIAGDCRSAGTRCVGGRCIKTNAQIACGGETCAGDRGICAWPHDPKRGKPHCVDKLVNRGGDNVYLTCGTSADCPKNAWCVSAASETFCAHADALATQSLVACRNQSDCKEVESFVESKFGPHVSAAAKSKGVRCLPSGLGQSACMYGD
jgi:hypothetical protein